MLSSHSNDIFNATDFPIQSANVLSHHQQHQDHHNNRGLVHTKRRWHKKHSPRNYRKKHQTTPPNPVMITVVEEEGDLFSVPNINPVGVSSFTRTTTTDDDNYEDIIEDNSTNSNTSTMSSPNSNHQLFSNSPVMAINNVPPTKLGTNNNNNTINKRLNSSSSGNNNTSNNYTGTSPMSSSPLLHYMIQNQMQKKIENLNHNNHHNHHHNCTILSSSPKNNVNIIRNKKKHNFHKKKKYDKKAKRYYREQRSKKIGKSNPLVVQNSSDNEATNEIIFDASKSSVEEDSYFKPSNRFKNNFKNSLKTSSNSNIHQHGNTFNSVSSGGSSSSNNVNHSMNSIFDEPTTPSKRFVVQDDDFFAIPKQEVTQRKRSYSNYSNSSNEDGLKPSQIIEFQRMSQPKPPQNIHFNTPIKEYDDYEFGSNLQKQTVKKQVQPLSDDIFNLHTAVSSGSEGLQSDEIFDLPSSRDDELQSDSVFDTPSSSGGDRNNKDLQSDDIFDTSSSSLKSQSDSIFNISSARKTLQSEDMFDIPSSGVDELQSDNVFDIPSSKKELQSDDIFGIPSASPSNIHQSDDIFSIPSVSSGKSSKKTPKKKPSKSSTTSTALQADDIFNPVQIQSESIFDFPDESAPTADLANDFFSIPKSSTPPPTPKRSNPIPKSNTKPSAKEKKKNKKHMVGNLVLEKHNNEAKPSIQPKAVPNYTESGSYLISDKFKCNEHGALQILDTNSPGITNNNTKNLYSTNHFISTSMQKKQWNSVNRSLSGSTINHFISIMSHAPKSKKRVAKFNKNINWNDLSILEELGSGFSSSVIKCSNSRTGQLYALKQIKLDKNDDKNSSKMIEAEFNCLVECQVCPYICSIVDSYHFIEDKTLYILLEFMDRGTFKDCVSIGDKVPEKILSLAACQLLMGLQFAHNKNIIHRDIKPENILLNSDGFVKLADWGMASILKNKTHANTFQGTASYMSPERLICSDTSHSFPCDVYSLGLTLVELALGYFPMPEQFWDFSELYNDTKGSSGISGFWLDRAIPFNQFSTEFSEFAKACLEKEPNERMNPSELLTTRFITAHNGCDKHTYGGPTHRRTISEYVNR